MRNFLLFSSSSSSPSSPHFKWTTRSECPSASLWMPCNIALLPLPLMPLNRSEVSLRWPLNDRSTRLRFVGQLGAVCVRGWCEIWMLVVLQFIYNLQFLLLLFSCMFHCTTWAMTPQEKEKNRDEFVKGNKGK